MEGRAGQVGTRQVGAAEILSLARNFTQIAAGAISALAGKEVIAHVRECRNAGH